MGLENLGKKISRRAFLNSLIVAGGAAILGHTHGKACEDSEQQTADDPHLPSEGTFEQTLEDMPTGSTGYFPTDETEASTVEGHACLTPAAKALLENYPHEISLDRQSGKLLIGRAPEQEDATPRDIDPDKNFRVSGSMKPERLKIHFEISHNGSRGIHDVYIERDPARNNKFTIASTESSGF